MEKLRFNGNVGVEQNGTGSASSSISAWVILLVSQEIRSAQSIRAFETAPTVTSSPQASRISPAPSCLSLGNALLLPHSNFLTFVSCRARKSAQED
jgi:hypothetical protein